MIPAADLLRGQQNATGVADRVIRAFPDAFRYRPGADWYVWRGTHWSIDRSGRVIEYISATVDLMIAAGDLLDPEPEPGQKKSPRDKWLTWCRDLGETRSLYAVERRLQTWPGVCVSEGWDADPWLFNAASGTIDLRTGEARAHQPGDLITVCAPASLVDPGFCFPGDGAHGSRWSAFLEQVLPDADLRAYIQRAIGQSLIGRQREHHCFMLTGHGGNGKGSFARGIAQALGAYFSTLPATFFVESPHTPHPTEIADLAGRRLVMSAEIPASKKFDETRLKEITGGDRLKARYIAKDFFEFDPSHTVWLSCNEKPRIVAVDNGIWRRMKVIRFGVTIAPEQMDRNLDETLASERDLILSWALEGCRRYLAEGLGTCAEVDAETGDYRASQDTLALALAEVCDFGADLTEGSADLHSALVRWWGDMGLAFAPNQIVLGRELGRRGFERQSTGTARRWRGLRVKDEWRQTDSGPRWPVKSARNWHGD